MGKSKWESHVQPKLELIEAWARDGLAERDIAHNLNVAMSTFSQYKLDHPELQDALARGKEYVDNVIVVNAYLRRATGYTTEETRREYKYMPNPDTGVMERVLVKESVQEVHIAGDARAMEFWLCNRQPDKWHRPAQEQNVKVDATDTGVAIMPKVQELVPPPMPEDKP